MAYAHFEDHDEVIVSTKLGTNPPELADFILGSVVKSHVAKELKLNLQRFLDTTTLTPNMLESGETSALIDETSLSDMSISPLDASNKALEVLRETTALVEKHIRALQLMQHEDGASRSSTVITTPEIIKRFKAVTSTNSSGSASGTSAGRNERGGGYGSVDRSSVIEMPLTDRS